MARRKAAAAARAAAAASAGLYLLSQPRSRMADGELPGIEVPDEREVAAGCRVGVATRRVAGRHVAGAEGVLRPVVHVAAEVARGRSRRVLIVVVHRVALHADLDRVHAFLDGGVLGLASLVQEHRDRDRGQDADDDDHDQELDEGEAVRRPARHCHTLHRSRAVHFDLPKLLTHPIPPFRQRKL